MDIIKINADTQYQKLTNKQRPQNKVCSCTITKDLKETSIAIRGYGAFAGVT